MKTNQGFLLIPVILVLLLLVTGAPPLFCQEASGDTLGQFDVEYRAVFQDVQHAISTGDIRLLSRHFAPQVAVNLRGAETGTFSSNQTYYVLENFLKSRKFAHFEFSTISESDATAYGSGEAEFILQGGRDVAQVYVAVSIQGRKYVITQLTIY